MPSCGHMETINLQPWSDYSTYNESMLLFFLYEIKVPFDNNMKNNNKEVNSCEKLENKLKYMVRCLLTF